MCPCNFSMYLRGSLAFRSLKSNRSHALKPRPPAYIESDGHAHFCGQSLSERLHPSTDQCQLSRVINYPRIRSAYKLSPSTYLDVTNRSTTRRHQTYGNYVRPNYSRLLYTEITVISYLRRRTIADNFGQHTWTIGKQFVCSTFIHITRTSDNNSGRYV